MTTVEPSCSGEVNMTARGCPLLRPVVVSSSTGMLLASHPKRPPLSFKMVRWTPFMVFNTRSLGTRGPYLAIPTWPPRGRTALSS